MSKSQEFRLNVQKQPDVENMTDLTDENSFRELDRKVCQNDAAIRAYESALGLNTAHRQITPGQRRAFKAGLAAGRARAIEEAAKVCEDIGKEIVCPEECAAAIRALT